MISCFWPAVVSSFRWILPTVVPGTFICFKCPPSHPNFLVWRAFRFKSFKPFFLYFYIFKRGRLMKDKEIEKRRCCSDSQHKFAKGCSTPNQPNFWYLLRLTLHKASSQNRTHYPCYDLLHFILVQVSINQSSTLEQNMAQGCFYGESVGILSHHSSRN